MTMQDILKKIGKLLKLAESGNVNEAATAAAQAQKLMDKYKIETCASEDADLEEEDIIHPGDPLEAASGQLARWKSQLAGILARASQCRIYLSPGRGIIIVGRESDIGSVRYLYRFLTREIDRLCNRDCKGCGRTYRNNFRLGAIDALREKLREQKRNTEFEARQSATGVPDERALVRVETAIKRIEKRAKDVEVWMAQNLRLGRGSSYRVTSHASARQAGKRAGRTITLNRARGALGSGG